MGFLLKQKRTGMNPHFQELIFSKHLAAASRKLFFSLQSLAGVTIRSPRAMEGMALMRLMLTLLAAGGDATVACYGDGSFTQANWPFCQELPV